MTGPAVSREDFDAAVRSGAMLDLTNQTGEIPAQWLSGATATAAPRGIRIRGARIAGHLDLSDVSMEALVLEDCEIAATVSLSHARLRRLSLKQSRICRIDAAHVVVDGSVDISNVAPVHTVAWIDFDGARISGGIRGRGARLVGPPRRAAAAVLPWTRIYALRLSNAQVRGGIDLNGDFVGEGGITLEGATVQGNVTARGARLTRCEDDEFHPGDCFNANSAVIDGSVFINFGVRTEGRFVMIGARIQGTLSLGLKDSRFSNESASGSWLPGQLSAQSSIVLDNASIGAELYLAGAVIDRAVSLRSTSVGGNVQLGMLEVNVAEPGRPPLALNCSGLRVGGGVYLARAVRIHGRLSLEDARIAGRLELTGLEFGPSGGDSLRVDLATTAVGTVIVNGSTDLVRPNAGAHPQNKPS